MSQSLTSLLTALPKELASTYDLVKLLAVGAYALVYQIQHKTTQKKFALKVIEKRPMEIRLLLPQLLREVETLQECSSMPHIVRLYESVETSTHIFLRFELCKTSLEDLCNKKGPLEEEDALMWLHQACLALQELHENGIIHRDVKPSNLLVDKHGKLRLCDFGFVCREQDGLSGIAGSPNYSAPEASFQNTPAHTCKVDIYSLGGSLQHLLLGRAPKGPEDVPEGLTFGTRELLTEMMEADPDDRPTIEELLETPQLGGQKNIFAQWYQGWQSLIGGTSR